MSWFDTNQPAAPMRGPSLGAMGTDPVPGAVPSTSQTGASFGNLSDPSAWMGLVGNQSQLTSWIQQQNPGLSPGLVQYYAQKIQGQPGANPTEQAGSANYWMQKIQADPTTGGGSPAGASGGSSASGMQNIPGMDPGYQFQFGQAIDALNKSAAAKGTLLTGGTLKAIADYAGNDLASSAYQGAFNRSLSVAGLGENAAAGTGQAGSGYANSATNALTNNANAQGAAGIAQSNLIGGTANNLGQLYALNQLNKPAGMQPTDTGYSGVNPSFGGY